LSPVRSLYLADDRKDSALPKTLRAAHSS
jgi:hypothetical protein